MTLKTQLNDSVKDAMKSGDEIRKRTIRMVLAAVKQAEVDKRSNPVDKRVELDDMAIMGLIQKEMKNRRESLEEASKANRADLVEANEAEINVLQAFLPKAMPADELSALVQAAIVETGAASPADMGKVMKIVMAKVAGRAPNDVVSATVRELLQPR
ncbi:MAG: GatB/YqeY domain-containing protein [Anaerolineales bacterium]